jgi:hypothetical protein
MRVAMLVVTSVLFLAPFANGQGQNALAQEALPPQSYMLTLVEFRMKVPEGGEMKVENIAKDYERLLAAGSLSSVETVRLSLLEGHPMEALFGKSTAIPTGVSQTVNGRTRSMGQAQIGTSVKATALSKDDRVLLKLSYEASRIVGQIKEEVTPDIERIKIDSSLLLENGKRVVVAGTSAAESSYLMVTLAK